MTPNGFRIRIPSNANLRIAVRFPKLSTLPKSIEQNSQLVEPAKAIECWILHFFVRTSHSPGNHMLFVDFGNLHLNSITIRVGYVLFYAHMTRKSIGKSKLSCQRNVALFATEKLYAIRNLSSVELRFDDGIFLVTKEFANASIKSSIVQLWNWASNKKYVIEINQYKIEHILTSQPLLDVTNLQNWETPFGQLHLCCCCKKGLQWNVGSRRISSLDRIACLLVLRSKIRNDERRRRQYPLRKYETFNPSIQRCDNLTNCIYHTQAQPPLDHGDAIRSNLMFTKTWISTEKNVNWTIDLREWCIVHNNWYSIK